MATTTMSNAQMQAEIARLQAENEALKAKHPVRTRALWCKVSDEKKALSLYGINTFRPVTLYAAQWERLLAFSDHIKAFIEEHRSELAWKEPVAEEAKKAA